MPATPFGFKPLQNAAAILNDIGNAVQFLQSPGGTGVIAYYDAAAQQWLYQYPLNGQVVSGPTMPP